MVNSKNYSKKTLIAITVFFMTAMSVIAIDTSGWINQSSFKNVKRFNIINDTLYVVTSGGLLALTDSNNPAVEYNNQSGLGTNNLSDIIIDNNGRKWVSGFGRLIQFDPGDSRQFLFFDIDDNLFMLNRLADDGDFIWVATEIGLVLFSKEIDGGQIQDSYTLFGNLNPSPKVNDILLNGDSIYIATDVGLAKADRTSPILLKSPSNWTTYDIGSNPELGSQEINSVVEYNNSIYVSTGSALFKFENNIFTPVDLGSSIVLYSILVDNDSLFVYYSNNTNDNIAVIENDVAVVIPTTSMSINAVSGINYQSQRWLGTSGDGLYYGDSDNFVEYPYTGLPGNNVYDLTINSDGIITANFRKLAPATLVDGQWVVYDFWIRSGLTKVISDSSGVPLIATVGNGLWLPDGDSLINYDENNSTMIGNSDQPPLGETFVYIKDMALDGKNFFAACYRAINNYPVSFVAYDEIDNPAAWDSIGMAQGLTDHFVSSLSLYKDELVVSSESDGVFRCYIGDNPQESDIDCVHYTRENSLLISNSVQTVRHAPNGVIWAGTNFGLAYLDDGIDRFRDVTMPSEISSDITALEFDGRGNLWVGTKKGLAFLDNSSGNFEVFTTLNSPLPSDRVNEIMINRLTGDIYIATEAGYTFIPSNIGPPVYDVDQVLAFPNPFVIDDENDRLNFNFGSEGTVDIFNSAGEKIINVDVNLGWDGTNNNGLSVSSGVYLFVITDINGNRSIGKILLVRQ